MTRGEYVASLLESRTGSSGQTCSDLLELLHVQRPPFLVWENVPELMEASNGANLNFFTEAVQALGYEVGCRLLVATDYFIPQSRRRVFGICLDVEQSGLSQEEAKDTVEGWAGFAVCPGRCIPSSSVDFWNPLALFPLALCYVIMVPGREIGPPVCLRTAGGPITVVSR